MDLETSLPNAMRDLAQTLAKRAELLAEQANALEADENLDRILGDQYSGPGLVVQVLEMVNDATSLRSNDLYKIHRALAVASNRAARHARD